MKKRQYEHVGPFSNAMLDIFFNTNLLKMSDIDIPEVADFKKRIEVVRETARYMIKEHRDTFLNTFKKYEEHYNKVLE